MCLCCQMVRKATGNSAARTQPRMAARSGPTGIAAPCTNMCPFVADLGHPVYIVPHLVQGWDEGSKSLCHGVPTGGRLSQPAKPHIRTHTGACSRHKLVEAIVTCVPHTPHTHPSPRTETGTHTFTASISRSCSLFKWCTFSVWLVLASSSCSTKPRCSRARSWAASLHTGEGDMQGHFGRFVKAYHAVRPQRLARPVLDRAVMSLQSLLKLRGSWQWQQTGVHFTGGGDNTCVQNFVLKKMSGKNMQFFLQMGGGLHKIHRVL